MARLACVAGTRQVRILWRHPPVDLTTTRLDNLDAHTKKPLRRIARAVR
jgi:hypothetical protein